MCRWLACSGTPVLLGDILRRPARSLVGRSPHSRAGVEIADEDGSGTGRYGSDARAPAGVRDTGPAWNNRSLQETADHVRSPLFFAHVRASMGTAVQRTGCHLFHHGRWMWRHKQAR